MKIRSCSGVSAYLALLFAIFNLYIDDCTAARASDRSESASQDDNLHRRRSRVDVEASSFGSRDRMQDLARNISVHYDANHPSYLDKAVMLPHYHGKRCELQQLQFATKAFLTDRYRDLSPHQPILVHSACLGSDSIGNYLGDYFETIVCAKVAKVTYIAVAKVWEPKRKHAASPFISALPSVLYEQSMNSYEESKAVMLKRCTCPSSCHEKANALWIHGGKIIKSILRNAMDYHLLSSGSEVTIVRKEDLSSVNVGDRLPLIPEVALHYRCGDNFIGYYGFLPYHVLISRIPADARTIYVLADARGRKSEDRQQILQICDAIFKSLFTALKQAFPRAAILVQRGGDLYADMARLAYARVTICSISTFCLWPAIAANGTAYFPRTELIAGGMTVASFGNHFHWIQQPETLLGVRLQHQSPTRVVAMLTKQRNS
jgi:hypothetical protein